MKSTDRKKLELIFATSSKEICDLKNEIEKSKLKLQSNHKEILLDIIQIIDTFEKAEETILEKGWDKFENVEQPIKRLLTAKKKTLSILDKHKVSKMTFQDNLANDDFCKTIDVEPDNNHPNNYILSIEKEGYIFDGKVLRLAEIIAVKN